MAFYFFQLFYSVILGFLSQNLALALGIGSGNLLKLSKDEYNGRRHWFFIIMFITSVIAAAICKMTDSVILPAAAEPTSLFSLIRPLVYVIVTAIIELALEFVLSYAFPAVREKIGDMLPSACFNSCVQAILLLNNQMESGFFECVMFAVTATAGFAFSVMLIRALRERMHLSHCPKFMKGVPIALLAAGILSLAFMGVMNLTFPYIGD